MIAAEARHLAERRAQEEDCTCKVGMFPRDTAANRRSVLFAAGSTARGGRGHARAPQHEPPSGKLRPERSSSSRLPIRQRSRGAQSPRTGATDRARSSRRRCAGVFPLRMSTPHGA